MRDMMLHAQGHPRLPSNLFIYLFTFASVTQSLIQSGDDKKVQLILLYAIIAVGTASAVRKRRPAKRGLLAMPMIISMEMSQMTIHSRRALLLSAT